MVRRSAGAATSLGSGWRVDMARRGASQGGYRSDRCNVNLKFNEFQSVNLNV